jgi:hypothetical protein
MNLAIIGEFTPEAGRDMRTTTLSLLTSAVNRLCNVAHSCISETEDEGVSNGDTGRKT